MYILRPLHPHEIATEPRAGNRVPRTIAEGPSLPSIPKPRDRKRNDTAKIYVHLRVRHPPSSPSAVSSSLNPACPFTRTREHRSGFTRTGGPSASEARQ